MECGGNDWRANDPTRFSTPDEHLQLLAGAVESSNVARCIVQGLRQKVLLSCVISPHRRTHYAIRADEGPIATRLLSFIDVHLSGQYTNGLFFRLWFGYLPSCVTRK